MMFQLLVIRLLVAILDRLLFPTMIDVQRDRDHQKLISFAINWSNEGVKDGAYK